MYLEAVSISNCYGKTNCTWILPWVLLRVSEVLLLSCVVSSRLGTIHHVVDSVEALRPSLSSNLKSSSSKEDGMRVRLDSTLLNTERRPIPRISRHSRSPPRNLGRSDHIIVVVFVVYTWNRLTTYLVLPEDIERFTGVREKLDFRRTHCRTWAWHCRSKLCRTYIGLLVTRCTT